MICAGSGRHAPQAIAGTAHKRPIGYCPHCARAHALTNAHRIWKHQDLDGPQTTLDDVPESETTMTRPRTIPDGPPMFVVECSCTDAESIRCRAHGPSPDDWADQVDEQRKRAEADLAELRDQISRQ